VRKTQWDCVNEDMRGFGDIRMLILNVSGKNQVGNLLTQIYLKNGHCACMTE